LSIPPLVVFTRTRVKRMQGGGDQKDSSTLRGTQGSAEQREEGSEKFIQITETGAHSSKTC
jgi:hypothetical protein